MKQISLFLIVFLFNFNLHAIEKAQLQKYEQFDTEFSKKLCTGNDLLKWNDLNSAYRGEGFYLPTLPNDTLDRETIRALLPELEQKAKFIQLRIDSLLKNPDHTSVRNQIAGFRSDLTALLKQKELVLTKVFTKKGRRSLNQSAKLNYTNYKKRFLNFYESISLFLGFRFPVDHLALRSRYDSTKTSDKSAIKKNSNRTYMLRRMVEDGAQDPDHKKSDMFLRTTLNTLYLAFEKDDSIIISEDIRFDVEYVLDQIERHLDGGNDLLIARHQEWIERTNKQIAFYHKILGDYDKKDEALGEQMIKELSVARFNFEEFVKKKQAEVYAFWSEKPEWAQTLYALDTILFNEVGSVDPSGEERRDVVRVVLNRINLSRFSTLSKKDSIYSSLPKKLQESVSLYPWLNVLFKESEFSFTFYFIQSNLKIFCPDTTKDGRSLRTENLKIINETLTAHENNFPATHYFSRASMIGHIDMSSLWYDLDRIPERRGKEIKDKKEIKRLLALIKKGESLYYYRFTDGATSLDVRKIEDMLYTIDHKRLKFYTYRSPHHFQYFAPKVSNKLKIKR